MKKTSPTKCLLFLQFALLLCLILGYTSRTPAQATQGGASNQWEGSVFTPKLDKVTQEGSSVLLTTLRTAETYDSNTISSASSPISTEYSSIEGQAQYSLQDDSDAFLLSYLAGGRFYPQYSDLNSSQQDARIQWEHLLTKRAKFTITGRWASLPEGAVETGNTSQEQSASFLQQRIDLVNGTVSYEYMVSPHSSMIVGGDYDSAKHFGDDFVDSKEQDVYAGYSVQVSRQQTVGVMYAHQWLRFSLNSENSEVDNVLFSYSNALTRNLSFSAFAGPAVVSVTEAAPSTTTDPSPSHSLPTERDGGFIGGARLEVGFAHNKLRADYTRLVTGGSGFAATILQQTSDLTFSHSFSRRLDLSVVGIYTSNSQFSAKNESFSTFYVEPSMHYSITPQLRLSVRSSVGRLQGQTQFGTIPRTEVIAQIEYRFGQIPIGR